MTMGTENATQSEPAAERRDADEVIFPPQDLDQLLNLARFVEDHTEPGLLLGPDGEQVPLPLEVYQVLAQVVEVMRQGKAISVAPRGLLLTTQEAADILGMSRPTIVKFLEEGKIPFEKPNRHRRIQLQDLLDFQERRRAERRHALNELTSDADDLGISDGSPEDYAAALKSARRRRVADRKAS